MQKLILYSGPQCHLCDQAFALLESVSSIHAQHTEKVNVASDHDLYHLYGARIPVLKRQDNGVELGWPFNEQQLIEFLS